jgi:hypothetical protein
MPLESYEYTRWQAWVEIDVAGSSAGPNGDGTFLVPVDNLRITAVPFSQGDSGATIVDDVNNTVHYVCDGWRHNLNLEYEQVPESDHQTLLTVVRELHDPTTTPQGEADISIAGSDGTVTSKTVSGVAEFTEDVIPAEFEGRMRRRPVTLSFKGKSLQSKPYGWLTD